VRYLALTGLLLVGCSHAQAVRGPNGESGWWVARCAGDKGSCEEAAAAQCPGGFRTSDDGEHAGAFAGGQNQGTVFDATRNAYVGQTTMTGNFQGTSSAMATGEPRGRIWFTCGAPPSDARPAGAQ
jgi:hypothetical protein